MLYCTFYIPTYNIIKQKSQTVHVLQFILHTYTQAVSRRRVYKKKASSKNKKTHYLPTKTIIIQTSHSARRRRQYGALYLHPSILYLSIFVSVYNVYVFISITKQQYPTPPKYYYYIILQVHSHCRIIFSLWCTFVLVSIHELHQRLQTRNVTVFCVRLNRVQDGYIQQSIKMHYVTVWFCTQIHVSSKVPICMSRIYRV